MFQSNSNPRQIAKVFFNSFFFFFFFFSFKDINQNSKSQLKSESFTLEHFWTLCISFTDLDVNLEEMSFTKSTRREGESEREKEIYYSSTHIYKRRTWALTRNTRTSDIVSYSVVNRKPPSMTEPNASTSSGRWPCRPPSRTPIS